MWACRGAGEHVASGEAIPKWIAALMPCCAAVYCPGLLVCVQPAICNAALQWTLASSSIIISAFDLVWFCLGELNPLAGWPPAIQHETEFQGFLTGFFTPHFNIAFIRRATVCFSEEKKTLWTPKRLQF